MRDKGLKTQQRQMLHTRNHFEIQKTIIFKEQIWILGTIFNECQNKHECWEQLLMSASNNHY